MKKKKKKKDKSKDGGGEGKGEGGGGALALGLDDLFDASGAPAKKKRRVSGPPRPDAAFGETASGMGEGGAEGGAGTSGGAGAGGEAGGDDASGAAGAASSSSASASAVAAAAALPWAGSDRDYTYAELLDRVFATLRANNPELTGEKRRTLMKPPQVAREGTKKTVFANFAELCKAMNRPGEHVQAFLLAELGTSGNLDGQSRLIVKGRFLPKVKGRFFFLFFRFLFSVWFFVHHHFPLVFFRSLAPPPSPTTAARNKKHTPGLRGHAAPLRQRVRPLQQLQEPRLAPRPRLELAHHVPSLPGLRGVEDGRSHQGRVRGEDDEEAQGRVGGGRGEEREGGGEEERRRERKSLRAFFFCSVVFVFYCERFVFVYFFSK